MQLEEEKLLVRKSATSLTCLVHRLREVHAGKRRLTTHEAVLAAKVEGKRIVGAPHQLERVVDDATDKGGRHLLSSAVHGDDHPQRPAFPTSSMNGLVIRLKP